MGMVYKAFDEALNRYVALKTLSVELANDPLIVERFINEAKTAAKLIHPHIIQIYYIGEQKGIPFFTMEYVQGMNLSEWMKIEKNRIPEQTAKWILQCLEGITFAHKNGVLHRDIKPENLILSKDSNTLKIVDFGLAKIVDDTKSLTLAGSLIGSPAYMSPEQVKGKPLDFRSDLYSLGVLYFYLLSGRLPFESENPAGYLFQKIHNPAPSVKQFIKEIPESTDSIIARLLERESQNRYSDTESLVRDIENTLKKSEVKPQAIKKNHQKPLKAALISIFIISLIYLGFMPREGTPKCSSPGAVLSAGQSDKKTGIKSVSVHQKPDRSWELLVDEKPYLIKGIHYDPVKTGTDFPILTKETAFDSWVDTNHNNQKDPDEQASGDFKLLSEMGVNTIRIFYSPSEAPRHKKLFKALYEKYGISVIMNHTLYPDTDISEQNKTDYAAPEKQKIIQSSVMEMVEEYKNEPYVLLWMLGNENNIETPNLSAYCEFVGKLAGNIRKEDSHHPVAVCDGHGNFYPDLSSYKKFSQNIDLYALNALMGPEGFFDLWNHINENLDRPVIISSFGTSAYRTDHEDEELQYDYLKGCWEDILSHSAWSAPGKKRLPRNAVGGIIMSWLDSWALEGNNPMQDKGARELSISPDGLFHQEWTGVMSQGDGKNSPLLRRPRKAYFYFKKIWHKPSA